MQRKSKLMSKPSQALTVAPCNSWALSRKHHIRNCVQLRLTTSTLAAMELAVSYMGATVSFRPA